MTERLSVSRLLASIEQTADIASVLLLDREGAVAEEPRGHLTISRSTTGDPLPQQAFDLVIVVGEIEHRDARGAAELLGSLRNRCAPRLLLACRPDSSPLDVTELRALGFQPVPGPGHDLCLFYYDIDAYNATREWNNPTNWAHPANFGKDRW